MTNEIENIKAEIDSIQKQDDSEKFNFKDATLEFTNYLQMAEKFLELQPLIYDETKVWWLWDFQDNKWVMTDETNIMNALGKQVNDAHTTVKSQVKSQIIEALQRLSRLNTPEKLNSTWVQFKNKLVDIKTGEEKFPTPKYFCTNPIAWEIGESEDTPTMDRIFTEWVGEENVIMLYEIISYCMLPDYPLNRIFALLGSGSNGKSCFLDLIKKFLGKDNVVSTSLERLVDSRFEVAKLYKKLVGVMGETNAKLLSRTDLLKRATGGDLLPAEFKGKQNFDFVNYAKLIISSNSLPATLDKTRGYYRRWIIVDFPNEFDEKIDIMSTIPEEEYRNLAKKCIRILNRIITERTFTNEGTIKERMRVYEERSNPTLMFLKANYIRDIKSEVKLSEFYEELKEFFVEKGHRELSSRNVATLLKDSGYDVTKKTINKVTTTWILGLKKIVENTRNTSNTLIPTSIPYRGSKVRNGVFKVFEVLGDKILTFMGNKEWRKNELIGYFMMENHENYEITQSAVEIEVDKLISDGKIMEISPKIYKKV